MDWLSKIQGNMQALINSGRIKPETASKLEQFAAEQKQRAAQQSGLQPVQLKSNQKEGNEAAAQAGASGTDFLKDNMSASSDFNTTANLGNYSNQLGAAFPSAQAAPSASSLAMPELGSSAMGAGSSGSMLGLGSLMGSGASPGLMTGSDKKLKKDVQSAENDVDSFISALAKRSNYGK